jgi:hypothetical protein
MTMALQFSMSLGISGASLISLSRNTDAVRNPIDRYTWPAMEQTLSVALSGQITVYNSVMPPGSIARVRRRITASRSAG